MCSRESPALLIERETIDGERCTSWPAVPNRKARTQPRAYARGRLDETPLAATKKPRLARRSLQVLLRTLE